LIRTKIDDVLTRPVDSSGKTLTGCTSSTQTWIEWAIKRRVEERQKTLIQNAEAKIKNQIDESVKDHLNKFKDGHIKKKVGDIFADYFIK
jgi:hypothetical protein